MIDTKIEPKDFIFRAGQLWKHKRKLSEIEEDFQAWQGISPENEFQTGIIVEVKNAGCIVLSEGDLLYVSKQSFHERIS